MEFRLTLMALCAIALASCDKTPEKPAPTASPATKSACMPSSRPDPGDPKKGMVYVKGGTFTMGAKPEHPEEGPPQTVKVGSFWIDPHEVTNAEFAEFIEKTGYVTMAEKPLDPNLYPGLSTDQLRPSSIVFVQPHGDVDLSNPGNWWQIIQGANWRHPEGPASTIKGRENFPVVQVAFQDALAYAKWAGRDLPSEAEWEYAARGGLDNTRFTWGDTAPTPEDANAWNGIFPVVDTGDDGYKARSAPVGCFKPNKAGLYDMAGNVWEWTSTWYKPGVEVKDGQFVAPDEIEAFDPGEPGVPKHIAKGGSFLCADNYCLRYRPSARTPGPPDTGTTHIGFRTIVRDATD